VFTSSTREIPDAPQVPRHVAIIMDGNGRWAKRRHLPRVAGHRKGVEAVRGCVRAAIERGVEFLTLFAFSSENWRLSRKSRSCTTIGSACVSSATSRASLRAFASSSHPASR